MNNYKLLSHHSTGLLQLTDIIIDSTDQLRQFQKIVGGYIEIPYISEFLRSHRIDIIINEEGKILELPVTAIVAYDSDGDDRLDVICGNVIFASNDDEGNTIGLTAEQMKIVDSLPKTPIGIQIPVRK